MLCQICCKPSPVHESHLATQSQTLPNLHIKLFTFVGFGHPKLLHMGGKRCLCDDMWGIQKLSHMDAQFPFRQQLCAAEPHCSKGRKTCSFQAKFVTHLYTFVSQNKVFCQYHIRSFRTFQHLQIFQEFSRRHREMLC